MSDEIEEIWALYADDGAQSLQAAEDALIRLKREGNQPDCVAALFRALHTFKGNSRLLGLSVVESRAHVAEDLVGIVRDDGAPLDQETLSLLLEATDTLRAAMDDVVSSRQDIEPSRGADLVARMQAKIDAFRQAEQNNGAGEEHSATAATIHIPVIQYSAEHRPAADTTEPYEAEAAIDDAVAADTHPEHVERAAISRLGDDPLYLDIFLELARQTLTELDTALAKAALDEAEREALTETITRVHDAAERIQLDEWAFAAGECLRVLEESWQLGEAVARLRGLYRIGMEKLGKQEAADSFAREHEASREDEPRSEEGGVEGDDFLARIEPLLATLTAIGSNGDATAALRDTSVELSAIARDAGFVGLASVLDELADCEDAAAIEKSLFDLYDGFVLIGSEPGQPLSGEVNALASLQHWCSSKSSITLGRLALAINGRPARDLDWLEVHLLMKYVRSICHARNFVVAEQVAGALLDLAARVQAGDMDPDPPLLRIFFSFVEAMKPLLLEPAERARPEAAETLLRQTSAAMSSLCAQGRHGRARCEAVAPASFQGMLSAESIEALERAIEEKRTLFVIRADTERNSEIAAEFLNWLVAHATLISSLTLFDGNATLFDFLVATERTRAEIEEALRKFDPEHEFFALREEVDAGLAAGQLNANGVSGGAEEFEADSSSAVLESIGEIITSHGALRQILQRISSDDGFIAIERQLSGQRDQGKMAQAASQALQDLREGVEHLSQLEYQIAADLDRLQRRFVASRLRPVSDLLDELRAVAREKSMEEGAHINVTIAGGEESIDADIITQLQDAAIVVTRHCAAQCLSAEGNVERKLEIAFVKNEKRVSLSIACSAGQLRQGASVAEEVTQATQALRSCGGDIKISARRDGAGVEYVLTVPQTMAVMDGMVVKIGHTNYVVPLQSVERIIDAQHTATLRITAANGQEMLRIDEQTIVPIIHLEKNLNGAVRDERARAEGKRLFVVTQEDGRVGALRVDHLLGQQPLLVRPLKGYLSAIRGVNGCAPLGDGGVGMVIDPGAIFALSA